MTMEQPPHANWNLLHDRFYRFLLNSNTSNENRKVDIYDLKWKGVELSQCRAAGAPFGGPIALVRDETKLLNLHQNISARPIVQIYSGAGLLLEQYPVDDGKLVAMGWTNTDNLACVMENGLVVMYGLSGIMCRFSLGEQAREAGVIDCRFWDSGLIAITKEFKLIAVSDFLEPRPKLLADPKFRDVPHSWCIIPPQFSLSRHVEVLAAVGTSILTIDFNSVQDQFWAFFIYEIIAGWEVLGTVFCRRSPISSFNGLSAKPSRIFYKLKNATFRYCMVSHLCGSDSVILHWHNVVLVIGPFGDWIKFDSSVESVFRVGSTTSSAFLFDAFDHFERKSPKADENVRSIKTNMNEAVESCLDAALNEFDHVHQRRLLKLLENEPKASYQVPLLLSMDEDEGALKKSIESGDVDMILQHLKRKHPIAEFFRLLHGKPLAISLLEKFAKEQDMQLLKDFYYQDDRRVERANVVLLESFEQMQLPGKIGKLRECLKIYSEEKDRDFDAKIVDDQVKLLQAQATLEREVGQAFLHLTVTETVAKCLQLGHFNRATKLKSDFKIIPAPIIVTVPVTPIVIASAIVISLTIAAIIITVTPIIPVSSVIVAVHAAVLKDKKNRKQRHYRLALGAHDIVQGLGHALLRASPEISKVKTIPLYSRYKTYPFNFDRAPVDFYTIQPFQGSISARPVHESNKCESSRLPGMGIVPEKK
ncbi:hypothetical protein HDU67_001125 [Dinochytrium kinnereticum]|nr:hypothetical protein HDU67_001125 [Dinochytrium kinnereticum]